MRILVAAAASASFRPRSSRARPRLLPISDTAGRLLLVCALLVCAICGLFAAPHRCTGDDVVNGTLELQPSGEAEAQAASATGTTTTASSVPLLSESAPVC
jgi:hypothetical protein